MWKDTGHLLMFLLWILLADYTLGQQPSPIDPCKLYDFNTGLTSPTKQFEIAIKETDGLANVFQVVKVPISGRTTITLVGETPSATNTLSTYGIQFYYNSGNGFMEMSVGKAIDRDGLDYQNNDDLDYIQFNLECQFFTSGGTSAKDYFGVTVRVLDSNDNSPVFVNLPYNVAIKEALPISTTVYDFISATDKDANRNKEILFAITAGAAYAGQTYFNMPDPGVGYIMLSRSLDYEFLDQNNAKEFRVTITARDNAVIEAERRTSTSTVTITIEDSDDLTPTFYHTGCRASSTFLNSCDGVKYKATITSGIVTGGSIPVIPIVSGTENTAASIRAFDMDRLNAPIVFEIIGSTPSGYENRFAVSTSALETDAGLPGRDIYRATLTQTSSITRLETKTLCLFIKARQTDDPQKYRISEIDLTVQPSNQNNPVLTIPTGTTGFIEENVAFGTNVRASATGTPALVVVVTDADLVDGDSQSYNYTIVTPGIPFSIQSSDGPRATIYANQPLNREAVPSYTFTVRATENVSVAARSGDLLVTVHVQDINDNTPAFTGSSYTRTIVEGDYSGVNRVLLTDIRATDMDDGDNGRVSYSVKSISVTSGSLTTSQVLSFLTMEPNGDIYLNGSVSNGLAFVATVFASDNGAQIQMKATETLTVNVTSLGNNPPQFCANKFAVQESEASPGGTFVLAITAIDAEDSTLSYTIQTPYIVGTSNKFIINGTTEGTIRVAGLSTTYPLDYETEPKYAFIVRATDSTGRTGTTTVTVDIINMNDNPPIFSSTTYTFSADEGHSNELIGSISGSDLDNDTVYYSLFNTTTGIFTINSFTGEIRTTTILDYETTKQYILVALITDNGNPPLTGFTQVTVNVNDINDNVPLFSDLIYQGYLIEGQSEASVLRVGSDTHLRVQAFDADSVPRVSYKFQIEPNNDFNIDANTGALTTKRALDCERTYQFYVTTVEGATVATNSPNSNARAFVVISCESRGEPSTPCKDGKEIGAGVGAGIGIAALLVAFIVIFVKRFQTRKKKDASATIATLNELQTNSTTYTDLQRDTNTSSEYSELSVPQDASAISATLNEQQTNNTTYTDLQRDTNTSSEYSELSVPQADGSINSRASHLYDNTTI